jgi:Photosynthetic reaction centre cytochrome C subunit
MATVNNFCERKTCIFNYKLNSQMIGKKLGVIVGLAVIVSLSIAATTVQQGPPQGPPRPTNLKVLPKDISHEDLDKIMGEFKNALGVRCNFCHAQSKDDPKRIDWASDEKPEKQSARYMMKMTTRINKKFFHVKKPMIGDSTLAISCGTCHNGKPHPEFSTAKK